MQTEIADIRTYRFKKEDRVLLDANIWLHIDGPNPTGWETEVYSDALKRIRASQTAIYLNVVILSEFINRYARIHQRWAQQEDFKEFRKSAEYGPVAASIASAARRILKQCHWVANTPEKNTITKLVDDFESEHADFNDLVLAETCRSQGLTLMTHDRDFRASGLTILTANRTLLAS